MASRLYFIVVLCLTSGLWAGADAKRKRKFAALSSCSQSCPVGWTQVGSRCYKFESAEKEWVEAELACIALGGNLASIRTAEDYAILREVVNKATGKDKASWIGGYDAVKEGAWTWSDGSAFEFSGWAKGEPNNYLYAEHCMEMNFEGRDYVNDERCNEWRSFICAKDAE